MAHVYYHGVKNSSFSSGGDPGGVLIVILSLVILLPLFLISHMIVYSLILLFVLSMFVSDCYELKFYHWPLMYLFLWSFNIYNDWLHPNELHGWGKIFYYLGILCLSISSTFGIDIFLQKSISNNTVKKYLEWVPFVLTYLINFNWTNTLIMNVIKGVVHFIEWIGKAVG